MDRRRDGVAAESPRKEGVEDRLLGCLHPFVMDNGRPYAHGVP